MLVCFWVWLLCGCASADTVVITLESFSVVEARDFPQFPYRHNGQVDLSYHAFMVDLWEKKDGNLVEKYDVEKYYKLVEFSKISAERDGGNLVLFNFKSKTDFLKLLNKYGSISVDYNSCLRGDIYKKIAASYLYWEKIGLTMVMNYNFHLNSDEYHHYYSLVDLRDLESFLEGKVGGDGHSDLCIEVTGGFLAPTFKSNILVVKRSRLLNLLEGSSLPSPLQD